MCGNHRPSLSAVQSWSPSRAAGLSLGREAAPDPRFAVLCPSLPLAPRGLSKLRACPPVRGGPSLRRGRYKERSATATLLPVPLSSTAADPRPLTVRCVGAAVPQQAASKSAWPCRSPIPPCQDLQCPRRYRQGNEHKACSLQPGADVGAAVCPPLPASAALLPAPGRHYPGRNINRAHLMKIP